MIKKILKSYLAFGLGMVVGSAISAVVSWTIMSLAYGNPNLEKVLDIRECLEEKKNE